MQKTEVSSSQWETGGMGILLMPNRLRLVGQPEEIIAVPGRPTRQCFEGRHEDISLTLSLPEMQPDSLECTVSVLAPTSKDGISLVAAGAELVGIESPWQSLSVVGPLVEQMGVLVTVSLVEYLTERVEEGETSLDLDTEGSRNFFFTFGKNGMIQGGATFRDTDGLWWVGLISAAAMMAACLSARNRIIVGRSVQHLRACPSGLSMN